MNKVTKNYIFNLLYEILAILVPFITTPYISRIMGPAAIGDFNYINSIVSYFGLVAATGTASFGNREIAVVQDNSTKRSILFFDIFFFRLFCTGIALIPYIFLIIKSSYLYKILFLVNLLMFLSWIFDISWFCKGMENFAITAVRNSIVKICGAVLIFLLVKSPEDLWKYTFIYSGTMLLGNLTMWVYAIKHIRWPGKGKIKIWRNFKTIMQLFIPVIAVQIYTVMDRTMLGAFDNTVQVGYYSQGHRIIELAMTIVNSFIAVLLPRIAFLYSQRSYNELKKLLYKTIQYIFLLGMPMMVGSWLVIDQFVPIFFGKGYEPVSIIIKILSCMFIVLNLGRLFGTLLVAINKQNQYTMVTIIAALINLMFNTLFILKYHFGAIGVACASVIAETCSAILQLWYVRKYIKIKDIVCSAIQYSPPTIIMGVAIIMCKFYLPIQGILSLIIEVCVGFLIYFTVLLFSKNKFIIPIIKTILKKCL